MLKIKDKYICIAPSKDMFDVYENYLGESGERALYYSEEVGKHRIYRHTYPLETEYFNGINITKDFKLFEFKTIREAQEYCNEINEAYNDNFEPRLIEKAD